MSPVLKAGAAIVFGFVVTSSAHAQEAGAGASLIGDRVRVRHCNGSQRKAPDGSGPCFRTEGRLVAVTADALRVERSAGSEREIPHSEVQRFERSLGSARRVGRGALIGGGIGLGLGLVLGVAVAAAAGDDAVAAFVVGVPLVGGAFGALIGAGIGALPKERWADIAADQWAVTAVGGGGRVGLGLRLAF